MFLNLLILLLIFMCFVFLNIELVGVNVVLFIRFIYVLLSVIGLNDVVILMLGVIGILLCD